MTSVILLVVSVLAVIFVLASILGLFLAWRDIKKNKNLDCKFRSSRKSKIKNNNLLRDNLSAVDTYNRLSPADQEKFKSELLKKLNEGGIL